MFGSRLRTVLVYTLALLAMVAVVGMGTAAADAAATAPIARLGGTPDLPYAVPLISWVLDIVFGIV